MARSFQGKSGYARAEWPNKKKARPEELTQDTPEEEEEEAEFVHTLSPKQKAEYDGLDKEQKALVKYVLGVPGVDVSKIDLIGNKQKESPAVSAPPLPSRREDAHSGSGRSFGMDAGIGTQVRTGSDGVKKRRLEADFRNAAPGSEDWGTGFTHRSGSFSADASGSGTKPNTNQAVFTNRASSMPRQEKRETVWQRILKSLLEESENHAPDYNEVWDTLFEGNRKNNKVSEERQERVYENRKTSSFRGYNENEDQTETDQNLSGFWKRQLDSFDSALNNYAESKSRGEQMLSTHNDNVYDEFWRFVKHPGENLDRTIKTTRAIDKEVKKMKSEIRGVPVHLYRPWTTLELLAWQTDKRFLGGTDRISDAYKDGWVSAYRDVIKKAADVYDIPPELLAGVAWIEVAGDAMWADPGMYAFREFAPNALWRSVNSVYPLFVEQRYRDASQTSFGYVSMQLGVAANMLGIEPEDLNINTEKKLAEVLSDPKMSIMFAARHLAMLKNIDFPDIPTDELTDDDVVVIANRYNMGGDVPIEAIRQHYYGQRFMDRMDIIEKLLYPDEG
jgi:hypothetical protein